MTIEELFNKSEVQGVKWGTFTPTNSLQAQFSLVRVQVMPIDAETYDVIGYHIDVLACPCRPVLKDFTLIHNLY